METVAGVFRSRDAARKAADELRLAGFTPEKVNLLFPGSTEEEIHSVPTSETEQPGVGSAIGGVVGATLGAAGGFELGVAATALIPGVGPVLAAGVAGAALLGVGGLVAGAELGGKGDAQSTEGIPSDELFYYEDALRQGRSVVIAFVNDAKEKRSAEIAMQQTGAESMDAARQTWWVGLRDVEQEYYEALGHNFAEDQGPYRDGFESAVRHECRGKSFDEASDCLKWWYPETWDSKPFRDGFERGQVYWERTSGSLRRQYN
ncbi:MAG TPA: hypothetical protein VG456_23445 [Candidatus Sulfopaludibacter sp.]|jgi:hypothetical protein|nr:hypothetical protein [Candidatus Sulfopaludibacter sp.]